MPLCTLKIPSYVSCLVDSFPSPPSQHRSSLGMLLCTLHNHVENVHIQCTITITTVIIVYGCVGTHKLCSITTTLLVLESILCVRKSDGTQNYLTVH